MCEVFIYIYTLCMRVANTPVSLQALAGLHALASLLALTSLRICTGSLERCDKDIYTKLARLYSNITESDA